MQPGRFTELFFLDEATAFAAGHRPCALCRHADYTRFTRLWRDARPGPTGADAIDNELHAERLDQVTRAQRLHEAQLAELPDGAFVLRDDAAWLVRGSELLHWTAAGYDARVPRPADERVRLITPPSLVAVLGSGWESLLPLLHPSAD